MRCEAVDTAGDQDTSDESFLRLAVTRQRQHLRVPSRVDWVERTVMYLADQARALGACDAGRKAKLVTALTEALTNAIVHGNLEVSSGLKEQADGSFASALAQRSADPAYADRLVEIEMHYDGARCTWTISDQGPGFDVDAVLARLDDDDPSPEALLASGRGVLMMRAMLDEVAWTDRGRRVRMTLHADPKRRSDARVPAREPVRALPLDDAGAIDWDAAFDAVATNVSRSGVALLKRGLHTAQRLMIELHVDGRAVYVPAEVCNVTPISGGVAQVGCRFHAPDPAGDPARSRRMIEQHGAIDRLLDILGGDAPDHDERRRHARRAYTRPIRITAADGAPRAAAARDISKSGMAFVAEFHLERGERVYVGLEGDLSLPAVVMRCQRVAGRFHDIGVAFDADA